MRISEAEKKTLIILARRAIMLSVDHENPEEEPQCDLTETLKCNCGAFVSLYVKGELRGCIGTFSEESALYRNVENMAVSAALHDSRFSPVKSEELEELELEISVLSPRKRIYQPSEIELGRHGIFIKRGTSRGTLLPQVALAQNWTVDELLGNCSKYKAGIGWDGWKRAELYTYEAVVFRTDSS